MSWIDKYSLSHRCNLPDLWVSLYVGGLHYSNIGFYNVVVHSVELSSLLYLPHILSKHFQ